MRRVIPVLALLLMSALFLPCYAQSVSGTGADRIEKPKAKDKKAPKVYTNDDLEETSTRPSKVQDATARGAEAYTPPNEAFPSDSPSEPPAPPADQMTDLEMRIKDAEDNVRSLEQSAKELLWQYLQASDSNEILRLKAEQQTVLEQLEQAKSQLAHLKSEADHGPASTPEPTPPPG